jgi:transcriptional regulator with XRE-family HTH domain
MAKDIDRAVQLRLGARIRSLRSARGLTQEAVAARTDLTQKYVSALERGERTPSWGTLMAIAHQAFEIKLAWLMFGIDEDLEAEAQDLGDVLAGWPKEVRRDLLRAMELFVRAAVGYRGALGDESGSSAQAGSDRTGAPADTARTKRRESPTRAA